MDIKVLDRISIGDITVNEWFYGNWEGQCVSLPLERTYVLVARDLDSLGYNTEDIISFMIVSPEAAMPDRFERDEAIYVKLRIVLEGLKG